MMIKSSFKHSPILRFSANLVMWKGSNNWNNVGRSERTSRDTIFRNRTPFMAKNLSYITKSTNLLSHPHYIGNVEVLDSINISLSAGVVKSRKLFSQNLVLK